SSTTPQFVPPVERAAILLEEQHRPAALLFDGYRPAPEVDKELSTIIGRVRSRQAPIVIILSDREPETTVLGAGAEVHLSLAAFDETELRAYLEDAASGVEPSVSSEELDVYVEMTRARPDLVDSLTRLFEFARPDS